MQVVENKRKIFVYESCADSVNLSVAASESAVTASGNESSAEQNLTVEDVPSLLGVLLGLRNLMPLTSDAVSPTASSDPVDSQLRGSFSAKVTETDKHVDIVLVLRVNCFDRFFR